MFTLAALFIACAVGYRISLAIWPFTDCRACSGSGNNPGSTRKRWGNCRRCGGSGQKLRLGARLLRRRR